MSGSAAKMDYLKNSDIGVISRSYTQHRISTLKTRITHLNQKITQLRQCYSDKTREKFGAVCYHCYKIFSTLACLETHTCCAYFPELGEEDQEKNLTNSDTSARALDFPRLF